MHVIFRDRDETHICIPLVWVIRNWWWQKRVSTYGGFLAYISSIYEGFMLEAMCAHSLSVTLFSLSLSFHISRYFMHLQSYYILILTLMIDFVPFVWFYNHVISKYQLLCHDYVGFDILGPYLSLSLSQFLLTFIHKSRFRYFL